MYTTTTSTTYSGYSNKNANLDFLHMPFYKDIETYTEVRCAPVISTASAGVAAAPECTRMFTMLHERTPGGYKHRENLPWVRVFYLFDVRIRPPSEHLNLLLVFEILTLYAI